MAQPRDEGDERAGERRAGTRDDAEQDHGADELGVAGGQRERPLDGRAGGEGPLLERLVGLREAVRDVGPLQAAQLRLVQGERGEALDARRVDAACDRARQQQLHGRERLLEEEGGHGDGEPACRSLVREVAQRTPRGDEEHDGCCPRDGVHRQRAGDEGQAGVGEERAELCRRGPALLVALPQRRRRRWSRLVTGPVRTAWRGHPHSPCTCAVSHRRGAPP
ncbi:hypothetical protein GC089_12430 [Cellulomonas sp. JZ18]|uniref:hypothetical protein n=1 Tax=Cellulomonas sp. JZ18 TaxID=2654191 RepID=UPI0012D44CF8|nr:hypothetical protein [Cellulomonas sp. JZ18]QGQ19871.1 hypothetical protein GC089_12430 [Cellulomonas sp. JZ18]